MAVAEFINKAVYQFRVHAHLMLLLSNSILSQFLWNLDYNLMCIGTLAIQLQNFTQSLFDLVHTYIKGVYVSNMQFPITSQWCIDKYFWVVGLTKLIS